LNRVVTSVRRSNRFYGSRSSIKIGIGAARLRGRAGALSLGRDPYRLFLSFLLLLFEIDGKSSGAPGSYHFRTVIKNDYTVRHL